MSKSVVCSFFGPTCVAQCAKSKSWLSETVRKRNDQRFDWVVSIFLFFWFLVEIGRLKVSRPISVQHVGLSTSSIVLNWLGKQLDRIVCDSVYLLCRSCLLVSVPDCGVRGPSFEFHRGRLCLSRMLLWYAVLGTGCAPLLQRLSQFSLASLRVAQSSTSFGWGDGGNVTSVGWQVTLCDPIWHVSASSAVAMLHCELLYPYTLLTLPTL